MGEILLPTKGTQDSIKEEVLTIKSKVGKLGEFSIYNPVTLLGQIANHATPNTYKTLYSFNGEGYLSQILAIQTSYGHGLRVTADGVVVFESYCGGNVPLGLFQRDSYLSYSTSLYLAILGAMYGAGVPKGFPFVDSTLTTNNANCPLPQPIYFKQSLLIEIRCASANATSNYALMGGTVKP